LKNKLRYKNKNKKRYKKEAEMSKTENFLRLSEMIQVIERVKEKQQRVVILFCDECGKPFVRTFSYVADRIKKGQSHFFCSRKCLGRYIGKNYGYARAKTFSSKKLDKFC